MKNNKRGAIVENAAELTYVPVRKDDGGEGQSSFLLL